MREFVTFPDDAMLSVKDLAAYLGVGQLHAYELVQKGTVPSVRFGRLYRIPFWGLKEKIANECGVKHPERSRVFRH